MVLRTETFNQSVRTEYSEAVNARYTFQSLWVSDINIYYIDSDEIPGFLLLLKNHIFTARSERIIFIFHM